MKIGLYADPHYADREFTGDRRRNRASLQKIKDAYAEFTSAGCELAICLGDLADSDKPHEKELNNLQVLAQTIHSFPVPTFCITGNHDSFAYGNEEFYRVLGGCEPRDIHAPGLDLLFLDACYFKDGRRYERGDTDWRDTFLPDVKGLEKRLAGCAGSVYIFMHQNIDPQVPEVLRLSNDAEVRDILEKSGKVKAVYQGHHHPGHKTVWNGIEYISLPAMCEYENAHEIIEI